MRIHLIQIFVPLLFQLYLINCEDIARCEFEHEYCNWTTTEKNWFIERSVYNLSPEIDSRSAPFRKQGYYLRYSKSDKHSETNPATLSSEYYKKLPQSVCFTFNYYLFPSEQHPIELYTKTLIQRKETLIWKKISSLSDKWRRTRLSIQTGGQSTQFVFKIYSTFIAFDDFTIEAGNCTYDGLCDFESDTCNWTPEVDGKNETTWIRATRRDMAWGIVLPKTDHTTATENGYFIYPSDEIGSTQILSAVHDKSFGVHCLSFWFYSPKYFGDALNVWLQDANNTSDRQKVWTRTSKDRLITDEWQFAQVTISITKTSRIVIEKVSKWKSLVYTPLSIDDISLKVGKCNSIASCDFNENTCSFIPDIKYITLRHGFGRVLTLNSMPRKYSPPADSSVENGLYIYSDFSSIENKTVNELTSELLSPIKQGCVRFSYFINGVQATNQSQLEVKVRQNTIIKMETTINKRNDYNKKWKNVVLNISRQEMAFRIVFEMTGYEKGSIVAVDDIKYTEGNCDDKASITTSTLIEDLSCNFENGLCSWKSSEIKLGDPQWRTDILESVRVEIPTHDMTTQSRYGQYAYFAEDSSNIASATLTSRHTFGEGRRCLSFWYWSNGNNTQWIKVAVLNKNKEQEQLLFEKKEMYSAGWQQVRSSYFSDKQHQIVFYASGYRFLVAIDEVKVFSGDCPEVSTDYINCNFESGQCGFVPHDNKDVIWRQKKASELSDFISYDASENYGGHFMALDFDDHGNLSYKSQLISPSIHATDLSCLLFSSYLNTIGSKLNVYSIAAGSDQLNLIGQYNSGDKADNWNDHFIHTTAENKFKLIFEGEFNNVNKGIIALDNIRVTAGSCSGFMRCDFEEKCYWSILKNSHVINSYRVTTPWRRMRGGDMFFKIKDHTLHRQEAKILALVNFYEGENTVAAFKSTLLQSDINQTSICVQFAHYFLNEHKIHVLYGQNDQSAQMVTTVEPKNLKQWNLAQVDIDVSGKYYIYLIGEVKMKMASFVAVDDLSISNSTCPKLESQYRCKSGENIPISKVCDFKKDCLSGGDEQNCGDCSFDGDLCDYESNGFTIIEEQFNENSMAAVNVDGTQKASIQSQTLRNSGKLCRVNFKYRYSMGEFYHIHPRVDLNTNKETVNLWRERDNEGYGQSWTNASIPIGSVEHFKITFSVVVSEGSFSKGNVTFAIDDIRFVDCGRTLPTSHCGDDQFRCKNRVCIDKLLDVCDYENDCGDYSDEANCENRVRCDFEDGVCDEWVNKGWSLAKGGKNVLQGPTRDHTLGIPSGSFLLHRGNESISLYFVKNIYPSKDCRFIFFYNIYSIAGKNATLDVKVIFANNAQETISTFYEHNQYIFKKAIVDLSDKNLGDSIKLRLVPDKESNNDTDYIAIDDLSFTPQCFHDKRVIQ